MNRNNDKKSKIVLMLIIFFLFLLIATYMVYSYYINKNSNEAIKEEFFSTCVNNDFSFFMNNDRYINILEKMKNKNYQLDSNVRISTTMKNNMFSDLDLSKFELDYQVLKNNENNKCYNKIDTKYSDNHLLTVDCIFNDNQLVIKSDEIVNRYVGIDKNNFQKTINKLAKTNVDFTTLNKLKNFTLEREIVDLNNIATAKSLLDYGNIIKNNTVSDNFSKRENIVITLNSEQVSTTEYTLELDNNQVNKIFNELTEKLSTDNEIMSELVVSSVKNLESDYDEILEYNDNDNISEVSAEENNYNTSIQIWGENTTSENTVTNEVSNTQNTVSENTVSENTISNNTISNSVNNIIDDVVNNEISNNVNNSITNEISNNIVEENNNPIQNINEENTETSNEDQELIPSEEIIEEEDNFRTQGFIELNEDTEFEDDDEEFIVGENYEETIKNIDTLAKKIDWYSYLFTGAKVNSTQDELIDYIQKYLNKKIKENNNLIIKTYINNGKLLKINFEFTESKESLDFEIVSKNENEKYLNIALLNGNENDKSGYKIDLYQKNDDSTIKTKLNINKVHNNKINQKTNITLTTKGTTNSKKYTNDVEILYTDNNGKFNVKFSNNLEFEKEIDIIDLDENNCLFIDKLSDEELLLTIDAIKQKMIEVLKTKNRDLNIISTSNSSSVVQQSERQEISQEDANKKEEAKQALIQNISNRMREYLDNGTELKLQDLENLEIPGYEVEISLNPNLALISVNGYKFKLDSDFNLSDS